MEILENFELKPHTSFKIGGKADFFCQIETSEHITKALDFAKSKNIPWVVLGGGSNTLISDSGYRGLVIQPFVKGVKVLEETDTKVFLSVGSAENWDEFVQLAVSKEWWGIENLSYVPGSVGALAVQNVGAYGQEASEVIVSVTAYDTINHTELTIANNECGFYYRHSIFNTTEKGKYIILNTQIKLSKVAKPNLSYPDLVKAFENNSNPSISQVRQAIIDIRNKKYPFPVEAKGGSVGSFFQNPLLTQVQIEELDRRIQTNFDKAVQTRYLELKAKFASKKIGLKVSAFLIDICGLKGKQIGGAYINPNQPLVVLNDGSATAADVLGLSKLVRTEVYEKTGVIVPIEPEFVGFTASEMKDYLYLPQ